MAEGSVFAASGCALARWLFLRGLGAAAALAALSLLVQIRGLCGRRGVLPAGPPDAVLVGAGAAALVAAGLVTADVWAFPALVVFFAAYKWLMRAGGVFFAFQWDVLLLEAVVLGLLMAPFAMTWPALFLVRWALFRLMFESGVVKLTCGDPTWRGLSALDHHFETQPLPTPLAWYFHHTPAWFRHMAVVMVYVTEIMLPVLYFGSAGQRAWGFAGALLLQGLIFATGNYNFFNILTVVLALPLLGDSAWSHVLPAAAQARAMAAAPAPWWWALLQLGYLALTAVVSIPQIVVAVLPVVGRPRSALTLKLLQLRYRVGRLLSINSYGLFRVMTRERPEITVEASLDGREWRPYPFRFKPGDLARRPRLVAPHQPRLDWQMWFAALSDFENEAWFQAFLARLLEGSPAVLRLLGPAPFGADPPRFVRAKIDLYRFTSPAERRATGHWWKAAPVGLYAPVFARRDGRASPPAPG